MIVAGPEGFVKNQYRKFNMERAKFNGDDFAMMKAMIKRRFARMIAEQSPSSLAEERLGEEGRSDMQTSDQLNAPHPPAPSPQGRGGEIENGGVDFSKERDEPESRFGAIPDLVLIDGGEGQLAASLEALEELGLKGKINIAGIAKGVDRDAGRERFFIPGRAPFRLDQKSPVLYYLQRLRDEAHRFAIGAHRGKRSAAITKNPLDEIGGIGPARKRALLDRFGSARGVSRAALAELEEVEGVNKELAKRIYDFFHDKR
jgi:excinuclease ABC subunit C